MIDPKKVEEARSVADDGMRDGFKLQAIASLLDPHSELGKEDRLNLSILIGDLAESVDKTLGNVCKILMGEIRKED